MVWVLVTDTQQLISWKRHKDFHLLCLKTIHNIVSLLVLRKGKIMYMAVSGFLRPYLVDFPEGLP